MIRFHFSLTHLKPRERKWLASLFENSSTSLKKIPSEVEEAPPHTVLTLLTQIRSKEAITPILGIYGFMGFRGKNWEERTDEWSG